MPRAGSRVRWLEVSTRLEAGLAPSSAKTLDAWRAAALDLQASVVSGPAFWQTSEIEEAPALLQASVHAVIGTVEAAA